MDSSSPYPYTGHYWVHLFTFPRVLARITSGEHITFGRGSVRLIYKGSPVVCPHLDLALPLTYTIYELHGKLNKSTLGKQVGIKGLIARLGSLG